jgi:hypothetical protein
LSKAFLIAIRTFVVAVPTCNIEITFRALLGSVCSMVYFDCGKRN